MRQMRQMLLILGIKRAVRTSELLIDQGQTEVLVRGHWLSALHSQINKKTLNKRMAVVGNARWSSKVHYIITLQAYWGKNMSPMINDLDPLHSPRRLQMMEDMKTLSLGTWNNFWTCFVSHGLRTQGLDDNGDTQATNPSIFSRQFSCVEATGGSSTGQVSKGLGHGMEWRRPIYAVHTSFAYHCQSMMSMLDSFSYSLPSKLPIYLLTYIAS